MAGTLANSSIASNAFRHLELAPLSSFGDDSDQARAASECYDDALGAVLEEHDWSFARWVAELPELTSADVPADPDLPTSFMLPDDFVRIHHVYGQGEAGFDWRIDSGVLRTNQPGPQLIRYTRRIENEAQMPAAFRLAVALMMAILLSARELEQVGKRDRLKQDYENTIARAKWNDARTAEQQRYVEGYDDGDWASEARW